VRLRYRHHAADTGCLDDGHRIVGQFVVAEVRGRPAGIPVSAPVQSDDPMPGSQAFSKRGEETPAAVTPPAQEDHRVIDPGSLIVVGDTDAPGIGVPHLLLLRTENKYHTPALVDVTHRPSP
jgi:hypothetical protein